MSPSSPHCCVRVRGRYCAVTVGRYTIPLGRRRLALGCLGNGCWEAVTGRYCEHVDEPGPARAGRAGLGLAAKLKALVRSPVALRRQALRFGTLTRKRVSRKRSVEVWSNVSDETSPPREKGETTSIGTRKPRPIGPRTPWAATGSVPTVRYSPGVPAGAAGGAT